MIKETLKNVGLLALSLLPAGCHYEFTGPLLWNQGSSSAFDACVGFWVIDLVIIAAALINITDSQYRKGKKNGTL